MPFVHGLGPSRDNSPGGANEDAINFGAAGLFGLAAMARMDNAIPMDLLGAMADMSGELSFTANAAGNFQTGIGSPGGSDDGDPPGKKEPMGPFNQDDVNDGSSSASSDNGVTMKPASAYDYSKDEIDGKFTADWNYIANGTGGWWGSRMWNTFSRDWSASSTSQKVEFFQNTIVGGSGEEPIGEFEYAPIIRQKALQDPVGHNFPYSFDMEILNTEPIIKPDGYRLYRLSGSINDYDGFFEIGVLPNNIIDHRAFSIIPFK